MSRRAKTNPMYMFSLSGAVKAVHAQSLSDIYNFYDRDRDL